MSKTETPRTDAMTVDRLARWAAILEMSKAIAYRDTPPSEVESALCGAVLRAREFADHIVKLERELATAREQGRAEGFSAAREAAAKVCEKRAELRWQENGVTEHDTNASYYPRSHEWCETADEEDEDCATAIRALKDGGKG